MRTATWVLRGSVLLLAAIGGCGETDSGMRAGLGRLVVLSLEVPDQSTPTRDLHVQAQAEDRVGIEALEVRIGERSYMAAGEGQTTGTLAMDIPALPRGVYDLEVIVHGVDGKQGPVLHRLLTVQEREPDRDPLLDSATLYRRVEEWQMAGRHDTDLYPRGDLYAAEAVDPGEVPVSTNWWLDWLAANGPQPFRWSEYCPGASGIDLSGDVLRCWLDMNPEVAYAIRWETLDLESGETATIAYPDWTESMKEDLDTSFFFDYTWLGSGLQTPFAIPPDPSINMVPPTSWGNMVALNPQQAWVLFIATVAHSLALEIGGFVPWSVLNYGTDDLIELFSSKALFHAEHRDYTDFSYTGYWTGNVLHAFPKTTFGFFVDQNIIRPSHVGTITRILVWSGNNLVHTGSYNHDTDGKSAMEVSYMHWQYYGHQPVQRVLAGTVRESTTDVKHWTHGCVGTSSMYRSILRALNIPAYVQFGWGDDGEPHLDGHTVPIFPTIGRTMSHADEILAWHVFAEDIEPPPNSVSPYSVLIDWSTFIDWFFTHPDHNVGRQRFYELRLQFLPDEILDLYCQDLSLPLFTPLSQTAVYDRFSEHFTVQDLLDRGLWSRLADKAAWLGYCN
jgi:hypothetical protein